MKTKSVIESEAAEGYLITTPINVSYLTGFSGDSSELLITPNSIYLFTDSRYTLLAEKELQDVEIITTNSADRTKQIVKILKKNNIKILGIEKDDLTVNRYEKYKEQFVCKDFVDISELLLNLRAKKTPTEIECIKTAAKGNEYVLNRLIEIIKPGVSELDIKAELLYLIYKQGMESAFAPIIASGLNSAVPHAVPTDKTIKNDDIITIDFGCKYNGYCSDITRTFAVGDIDEQLKKIYHIVKDAQQKAVDYSKENGNAAEIDKIARDFISEQGYGEYFGHGTGHGVGMAIHEKPVLNPSANDLIEQDMVFTIEPGIYVPGLGGVRIEDTCIGNKGSIYTFTKDLIYL